MPEEQKTIMFYINAIHEGGAERVLVQLSGRFARAGYRAVLVTSFVDVNEYPVPEGVERLSIEGEQLAQSRLRRNLSRIKALRRLCREYRPAALISFMAEPNFRAILATLGLPVKNIISVRNMPQMEYRGRLGTLVAKYILPLADGCVFQTPEARAWFPKRLRDKSAIIMNQVSPAFFDARYTGEKRNIVAVGRLSAQKNHALLLRAYAALPETTGDELLIYGEGELRGELERLISELGLEGRARLMGLSKNVPEDIKAAKVFALPSDYEGMPNALMEAMALGLPCVATACPCGGAEMLIDDGVNGLLTPVGDAAAMGEKLRYLIQDDAARESIGESARLRAEEFRPDRIFQQWQDYVESVMEGTN